MSILEVKGLQYSYENKKEYSGQFLTIGLTEPKAKYPDWLFLFPIY